MTRLHSFGAVVLATASLAPGPTLLLRDGRDNAEPFAGGGYFGWVRNSRADPYTYNLVVKRPDGTLVQVNEPGTSADGGGIDGTTVIYSEINDDGRSRLMRFDLTTGERALIPRMPGSRHDSHPTVSGPWILFTRGDRLLKTRVMLFNRNTGELRELAAINARGARRHFLYA